MRRRTRAGGEAGAQWCCGSRGQRERTRHISACPTPIRALSPPPATHLPTPPPLTSSSAVQGRESEVLRRSEWPLARDVDDRRRLRAPLQLLGMLKAQRLW